MTRWLKPTLVPASAFAGLISLAISSPLALAQQAKQQGAPTRVASQPNKTAAAPGAKQADPIAEEFPAVIAVVNGQTISRDELGTEVVRRYGSQVLDNMLHKYLILQACQTQGVTITQQDVDEEISRIASKFGLTTQLYLKLLQDERNVSPEQYSSETVWPMLALRRLASDKIEVSREEIDRAFQSEFGAKAQVRMIAVKDQAKAEDLAKQAQANPEIFRRLAKEHSEDPASASTEGLLPPLRRFSGDDQLETIAFNLKPNEISKVFQIGEMYVILQLVRFVQSPQPSPQSLPAIEQRIVDAIRDTKLRDVAETLFETLQKQSKIVRVLGDANLEQQYPGVAAFINDQPVSKTQLTLDAIRRHGREVLKGEINRKLLTSALEKEGAQVTQADIDLEIARAADSMGFIKQDGTPDTDAWLKNIVEQEDATIDIYVRDAVWPSVALKKLVEKNVQVTEEDMQRGYESGFGPRAEVLAIVLSNQRTAHEVWELARNNNTEPYFGELASQYSIEPVSRSNYGKVPPIRKYSGNQVLEDQAFALKAGELSGIIALGDQYVILRSQGLTKPVVKEFSVVKDELAKEILEKKTRVAMQDRLDTMLKEAQIDNFLEKTSQSGKPAAATANRAAPQGTPTPRR